MKYKYIIIGAGISGLTMANSLVNEDYCILEQESEIGGYCRTVQRNGFVWDYAGHFYHFKDESIKNEFLKAVGEENIVNIQKNTKIYYNGDWVEYPFQKNIHQLPKEEFIDCLYDLYKKKEKNSYDSFLDMLYGKFGKSIVEKFLRPYNEKLYACDLDVLDVDAMGRFFPYANLNDIIDNMKKEKDCLTGGYNETFLYPKEGAITYLNSIQIDEDRLIKNCKVKQIDSVNKCLYTEKGVFEYEYLISTIPFCFLTDMLGMECDYSWNQVLVLNLGFDQKTEYNDLHWFYIPQKDVNFYRVGFYDNILGTDKGSLYVEIGFKSADSVDIEKELEKTLEGLRRIGIISTQKLVDYEPIIMNPAYVHIKDIKEIETLREKLQQQDIYTLGRYGAWTYCSMEDCILEARKLGEHFSKFQNN